MGCGEARLARTLDDGTKQEEVFSCDLAQNGKPNITRACSMNKTQLPEGSQHLVIFCLSLMGTDWLSFVREGVRIARKPTVGSSSSSPRGEIWIAEVKSRFENQSANDGHCTDTAPFIQACQACGLHLLQEVSIFFLSLLNSYLLVSHL